MKRIILFILLISISICGFCDEPVSCSEYQSNMLSNEDTTCVVLCAEDYHPRYYPNGILNEEPVTIFVDLGETAIYSISGHVEMTSLDMVDFIYIREVRADSSTIRLLGSYSGIQDIQLYTMRTRYIAIDIYCYNGAVSSTSGYTICISPVEQTSIINATIADKLGIGTTNPTVPLEVVGEVKIRATATRNLTISPMYQKIDFYTNTDNFFFNKPINSETGIFAASSRSNLTLQTDNTPRVTVLKNNGYVGIGTTEPQEMLHVNGCIRGSAENGEIIIRTNSGITEIGASNSAYSHFYTNLGGFYFNVPLTINGGTIRSHLNDDLKLNTFSTTRMTILNSNGNVGIGTTNPQYKLDVAGEIHSAAINSPIIQTSRVQTDSIQSKKIKTGAVFVESVYGADFVFDDNYQLRPLQEVYSYVQEHGHLPEIQSATDMQQNGVNMSEFQIQLLQKIEELTLYIIRQEERIKELENQISK